MRKKFAWLFDLFELSLGVFLRCVLHLMCAALNLIKKSGHHHWWCPVSSFFDSTAFFIRKEAVRLLTVGGILLLSLFSNSINGQTHRGELYQDCQSATCVFEAVAVQQALADLQDQCQLTVNVLVFDQNISLTAEGGQLITPDGEIWMDASVDYLLLVEPASISLFAQEAGVLVLQEDNPLVASVEASFSNLLPYANKNYCAIRALLSGLSCSSVTLPEAPCQVAAVEAEEDLTFLHLDVEELDLVQEAKRRLLSNHCAKVVIIKLPRLSPYYRQYLESHQLPAPLVDQLHDRYGREVTLILVIPDPQSTAYTLGIQHIQSGPPDAGQCASQVSHIIDWLPALEPLRLPAALAELEAMLKGGEEYQSSQLANLQLTFKSAPNAHYGFDTLQYPQAHVSNYEVLDPEASPPYYIPWQSIKLGASDPVVVRRKGGGFIPPEVDFVDLLGADVPVLSGNSQEKILDLSAPLNTDTPAPIYARLGAGNDANTIGQLNTVAYEEKLLHVVLVPVNGAQSPYSAIEIQNQLRSTYRQAVVEVSVTMHNGITVPDFNGVLEDQGSGFLSNYTAQMRRIIRAYKQVQPPQPNVYYLFLVNDHEEGTKLGYMPRKKVYGFIINTHHFNLEDYAKTIGHELGHGAYVLEHTFKTYAGQLPAGQTHNLMDYGTGVDLHKYQWDLVHDPANVWSVLDTDEDREYIIVDNLEPFKDFRNDDGDGVFDTDDSFTFLAPSGLPITIPASTSRVVFFSGDEVGGPTGIPSFEQFELMPFGTLRYFDFEGTHYNTYLATGGDFDFAGYADIDDVSKLYYDTLTPNLPNLSSRKAIIGFPCMEEENILYKAGQVKLSEVLTEDELAGLGLNSNYRAVGGRRAYDYLAETNIEGETVTIKATPDPPYLPEARIFLDRVGDAAGCNTATALYAFIHAHQISFYPGFYEACSETLAGLSTESMYAHKRELVQIHLDQGNLEVYGPYGDYMLAREEIETWRSYDKSIYRTYHEQMSDGALNDYLEGANPPYTPEMATVLVNHFRSWKNQPCVFDDLTWAHREKIIRILSTLELTEDNLIDNWYLVGDDEDEENLFMLILQTTPESEYGNLLTLFEDGGNYDLYFNVINKLHDGGDVNDDGYEEFVILLTKAVLQERFRNLANPDLLFIQDPDTHYCVEVMDQGCEEVISLHANWAVGSCVDDYLAEFTHDNHHRLRGFVNSNDCFIADNPYYASLTYDVSGRPFDYIPVLLCNEVESGLSLSPAQLADGSSVYVLPYCYVDLLIRKLNSAQANFQWAAGAFVVSLAAAPFTFGESTGLVILSVGDVAVTGVNFFVFAPAIYQIEVGGDSYLSQSVIDKWKNFELLWAVANVTGAVTISAEGVTKFTLSKARQIYDHLKDISQSTAEFYRKTGDLLDALRSTRQLLQATNEVSTEGLQAYLKAQEAAIDVSRKTIFIDDALSYPISINKDNFNTYYKIVNQEVKVAGGGFVDGDLFYIIPDKWDVDIAEHGTKVAELNDMRFQDLRPGGYGDGHVVTGDLEVFYHANQGFFFRLVGDLTVLDIRLLRFRELFLSSKYWNWDEFLGPFAEWVLTLPAPKRDQLYEALKLWPKHSDGDALFAGLKADMFDNFLPEGLSNVQFRDFLAEDPDRIFGWEALLNGPYEKRLGPIEFFSNTQVLRNQYRVLNSSIPAAHPDIPVEELTAIYHYTSGFEQNLNVALRNGTPTLFDQAAEALINTALAKLPPFGGNALYRGVRGGEAVEAKLWHVGQDIEFKDFKSTSADENIANGFAIDNGGDVIYEITNAEAFEIGAVSFFPNESESLFPTHSRFRVTQIDPNAEIVYKGNSYTVTRIYLKFLPGPIDPNDLYGIFRTRFLENGASDVAAYQLAEQTAEIFQNKGWGIQELTDELANVLVRADDQSTVILNRLTEWETEKLNVFLDDLAGEQGEQLVAFFGEYAEGVRAWEKMLDGGFADQYRKRILELFDEEGNPKILLEEGNPINGEITLTVDWYGEEITELFKVSPDGTSGGLFFRFKHFRKEGTMGYAGPLTHDVISGTPPPNAGSTFPVNDLLNMQGSVTNSGDGYYMLANAYNLYTGNYSLAFFESLSDPLIIWKSLAPDIPGVFTADHRRALAMRLAGITDEVSVDWIHPAEITINKNHWKKMSTEDLGRDIDIRVDYLLGDNPKFCPKNTPGSATAVWKAKWENGQYVLYDDFNSPISWETIENMIPNN